jgi:hypothetical protein
VLQPSFNSEKVREVVIQIANSWLKGSLDPLTEALLPDAVEIDDMGPTTTKAASPGSGASGLVGRWRERLRGRSFDHLPAAELIAPERIVAYSWDDLGGLGAPARPRAMRPGDVYVRAPFEVNRVGLDRVWADALLLVLRRVGDRYKVVACGEVAGL